jgi:hypothetical protein
MRVWFVQSVPGTMVAGLMGACHCGAAASYHSRNHPAAKIEAAFNPAWRGPVGPDLPWAAVHCAAVLTDTAVNNVCAAYWSIETSITDPMVNPIGTSSLERRNKRVRMGATTPLN